MAPVFIALALLGVSALAVYGVLRSIPYHFAVQDRRRFVRVCAGSVAVGAALLVAALVDRSASALTLGAALRWVSPAFALLVTGLVLELLIPTPAWSAPGPRGTRRFDADTRIGIVGAGPAGLAAAEELRERGYRNITILEARPEAGGKVSTSDAGGVTYEGGQVWTVPSARMNRYFRKYGIPDTLRALPPMRFVAADGVTRQNPWIMSSARRARFSPMRAVEFVRYLLALRPHSTLHNIGFRHVRYAEPLYAESSAAWFRRHRLPFMEEALGPLIQVSSCGHLVDRMPFGYVAKVLGVFHRYSFTQILTLALPGVHFVDNGRQQGNQAVWHRMAASHAGLRLGEPVDAVTRGGAAIAVTTRKAEYAFDQLIWAAPPMAFPRIVADASAEEAALFSRVRTYKRAVVTARIEGLPEGQLWLYRTTQQDCLPASHPRVMYETETGSRIYKFFPGFGEGDTVKEITRHITELAERNGATSVEILNVHVWDYYPHFSREDVLAGAWQRQEALQGQQRTWFVGELFAGASIPLAVEYAAALVHEHF